MWITKEGYEDVNLDFVQSIQKIHKKLDSNGGEKNYIKFYQRNGNSCDWHFTSKDAMDNFHTNLMATIGALRISENKDPLN